MPPAVETRAGGVTNSNNHFLTPLAPHPHFIGLELELLSLALHTVGVYWKLGSIQHGKHVALSAEYM